MANKIRLSYTFMEMWRRGKIKEAIDMYYHRNQIEPTPQMIAGKQLHEELEASVKNTKAWPTRFSSIKLNNPISEVIKVVDYNDEFLLKGVIDIVDSPTIYEFKTGLATSDKYAREYQVPIYFLLCELAEIECEKAIIVHHNQYTGINDVSLVWNGKRQIERARNYIDSIGSDIYNYFESQSLW